jgi:hypothetical protein
VDLVLHGEVDELGVGRGLAKGDGQKGNSLQVEDLESHISLGLAVDLNVRRTTSGRV